MKHPRDIWVNVRASFWFVPAGCVLAAVALAVGLVEAEQLFTSDQWAAWPRLFGAGAAGARGLLTAVASSMITVAGVVFSITIVALSLASSQYTSRILRNFMGDRSNQLVLGVFVGVFAYCLVVLRTIRGGDEGAFVPGLAVLVAVLLAFVGIGFLIFFIHHIALSIQASHIVAAVASETIAAVDRLFPEAANAPADEAGTAGRSAAEPLRTAIPASRTGYVQRVDLDALIAFARERQSRVRMEVGVGDFVIEGSPIASVDDASAADPDAARQACAAFTIDRQRTVEQDAAYGIRQLVDVALKALSPGINDTTTAVMCVDYLTAILVRLTGRELSPPVRDDPDRWRVITRHPTYADFVQEAFDQIRQNAGDNVAVLQRLLGAHETLSRVATNAQRRRVLFLQVDRIRDLVRRSVTEPAERDGLDAYAGRLAESLSGPG